MTQDRPGFCFLAFNDMVRAETRASRVRVYIDDLCSVATVDLRQLASICGT